MKNILRDKKGRFIKGFTPWNKGIPQSKEAKKKMSEALKGCIPWNKGTKGIMKPNKTSFKKGSHVKTEFKKGHKMPKEIRQKIRKANSGRNHYNWQNGITLLNFAIRNNIKYRQWRDDVFTRDNFTCQNCNIKGGRLHAHHIKSFSSILQFYEITTLEEALNCDELWNINNGITLHKECHKELHKKLRVEAICQN